MEIKNIYKGKEFKFYDELMALRAGLIHDFLNSHPNYTNLTAPHDDLKEIFPNTTAAVLNYDTDKMPDINPYLVDVEKWEGNTPKNYPTAYQILKRFPECSFSWYAVLPPHSVIRRHTGPENRTGESIRIHIPLIIPTGDIGFEVAGEIIDWSDLFAFNNQKLHSAWNNTDEYRLCFILDLPRSLCDLPPGEPWKQESDDNTPAFPYSNNPLRELRAVSPK